MRIQNKAEETAVSFDSFGTGEIFFSKELNSYFIKIEYIENEIGDPYNAVSVDDGDLYFFADTTRVIAKPNAVLVLE